APRRRLLGIGVSLGQLGELPLRRAATDPLPSVLPLLEEPAAPRDLRVGPRALHPHLARPLQRGVDAAQPQPALLLVAGLPEQDHRPLPLLPRRARDRGVPGAVRADGPQAAGGLGRRRRGLPPALRRADPGG